MELLLHSFHNTWCFVCQCWALYLHVAFLLVNAQSGPSWARKLRCVALAWRVQQFSTHKTVG